MNEAYSLTFEVCSVLVAVAVISRLFPEKSCDFVRGASIVIILAVLISGVMHIDISIEAQDALVDKNISLEQMICEKGIAELQSRLGELLAAADVDVEQLEVRYRQNDSEEVTIDRVCVQVLYAADRERAYALISASLQNQIPVEVYT